MNASTVGTAAAGRSTGHARRALTLVEMLAVIAIIGMLMVVLLPAVQSTRESSRKTLCQNRMRQLSIGMLAFVDVRGRFPQNMGFASNLRNQAWAGMGDTLACRTWIGETLPFLERADLFNAITFNTKTFAQNAAVYGQPLPEVRCPSDPSPSTRTDNYGSAANNFPITGSYGVTNYKSVCGGNMNDPSFWRYFRCGSSRWCVPAAGLGWDWANRGNGVACQNYSNEPGNVTYGRSLRDGFSKTLAIGEAVPDWIACAMWGHVGGASATCGYPLNYKLEQGESALLANRVNGSQNGGFYSRHAGGASFALCDGAVRWVANSISGDVYAALASIDGGTDSGPGLPSGVAVIKSLD